MKHELVQIFRIDTVYRNVYQFSEIVTRHHSNNYAEDQSSEVQSFYTIIKWIPSLMHQGYHENGNSFQLRVGGIQYKKYKASGV